MIDYTETSLAVTAIENESAILKTVLENCAARDEDFIPMLIFYSTKDTKDLVVAMNYFSDFPSKMTSIAEALHLYAALKSSAVIVAVTSTMIHEDEQYSALTLSLLTEAAAWNLVYPYKVEGSEVVWYNDIAYCNEIDSEEVDSDGQDVYTMFYTFTHIDHPAFSPSEVLSYLAFKGAAIHQLNTKIEYFAPQELEETTS